jgi:hypothetical protein
MKYRDVLFVIAVGVIGLTPLAKGQAYNTATVLYPLVGVNLANATAELTQLESAGGQTVFYTGSEPLLWTSAGLTNLSPTNLNGITQSAALATDGSVQVGASSYTNFSASAVHHALLWSGTAASAVDLNPSQLGITYSQAYGVGGNQQVGAGSTNSSGQGTVALLWTGTATSAVNLNPTNLGISSSSAASTDGIHQVGAGIVSNNYHALLWTSTAASAVDLNPTDLAGSYESLAFGVGGNQQVGMAEYLFNGEPSTFATLWDGTASSAVNLNPNGFSGSTAFDTNGLEQVGEGIRDQPNAAGYDALLWRGTADSFVDLGALLPSSSITWVQSTASTIDSAGNVFGVTVGTVNNVAQVYAVEWSPVPEPASGALMLIFGGGVLMRRSKRCA